MTTPTLSTLPEDIIDEILRFVEEERQSLFPSGKHAASSLPRRRLNALRSAGKRTATIRALALTSRSLLPSARRFLFAEPLTAMGCTWTRALALLRVLQSNGKTLGRLVRRLGDLPAWLSQLSRLGTEIKLDFQLRGYTKAFSWVVAVLDVCAKVQEVGLSFQATKQINNVFSSLSTASLRKIKLGGVSDLTMSLSNVQKAIAKLSLDDVKELELVGVQENAQDIPVPLPSQLSALSLSRSSVSLDSIRRLLPANPSRLRSFSLRGQQLSSTFLNQLVELIGATLTTLVIITPAQWYGERLATYGFNNDSTVVPLGVFSSLPNIRTLRLSNMRALSVKRLRTLSVASPQLVEINGSGSIWMTDDGVDAASEGWQSRLFPQQDLAEVLKAFMGLRSVHVGTVPLRDSYLIDRLYTLRRSLNLQGANLFAEMAEYPCEECGRYH